MSASRLCPRFLSLFALLLALAFGASAQYRAGIQGTVLDPQGAAVADAKVTVTANDTGLTQTTTTDASGVYAVNRLAPGDYSITVEKTGFKKQVIDKVTIIPEQINSLNISLEIGQVAEIVTVSGNELPAIDTESGTVAGTITSAEIQQLPSFGRDIFQLLQLAPGVFGDGAQAQGGGTFNLPGNQGPGGSGSTNGIFQTENRPQIIANGGRNDSNNVTLDGVGITSVSWGGAAVITPNEDSVKEVKVVANSYDAENGRFSGAQTQLITKNGTNDVHGSFFFKADRPGLNSYQAWTGSANNAQTPQRNTARFNQWGGSVGGPLWKNKLFGFFSYETIRMNSTATGQGWFETPQLLASAPAGSIASKYGSYPGESPKTTGVVDQSCSSIGLIDAATYATLQADGAYVPANPANPTVTTGSTPYTGGANCAEISGQGLDIGSPLKTALGSTDPTAVLGNYVYDPATKKKYYVPGVGSGLDGTADIMNANSIGPNNSTDQQFMGRVDFNATSRDLLAFTIYKEPVSTLSYNGWRVANLFHHNATNEAETGIWDHTFGPTLINEVRLNAAGWRWNELADNPQIPLGLPQPGGIGDPNNGNNIGSANPGSYAALGGPAGSIFDQWTYNAKDTVTKIVGSHSIRFGGEVTKLKFVQDAPWSARPNFFFDNYWDFLNDAPYKESGTFNPLNGAPTDVRKDSLSTLFSFFGQDDWKLRPNLTLNLGLRYDYFGPISFKHGLLSSVVLGSGADALTGMSMRLGGNLYNADKGNFGPQIGFAWSPTAIADHHFAGKLVFRGGFGIGYNGEQEAITLNGWPNVPFTDGNATFTGAQVVYAVPSDAHTFLPYPSNPNAVETFGSNNLPTQGSPVSVTAFPANFHTTYTYRYSLEGQYELSSSWVATLGYQGSSSRHLTRQSNLNLIYGAEGIALYPMVNNVDFYGHDANAHFNAMLAELQHRFAKSFELDTQYRLASSRDNASGPYSISYYQWNPAANWGASDFDVRHALKIWGVYTPKLFHGDYSWLEKIAGGWSFSGILNAHSGFPWTPYYNSTCNLIYSNGACTNGGQTQLLPAKYLGGAKGDHSNAAFLSAGGNFPNGGSAYFVEPTFTSCAATFPQTCPGAPQAPGIERNSFRGPRYFDVDATLSKSFGLPKMKVLGEGARLEFRINAYNLFNSLNLDPTQIDNNINDSLFGQAKAALGARTVEMQARFSF